jgi:hypothetical protein
VRMKVLRDGECEGGRENVAVSVSTAQLSASDCRSNVNFDRRTRCTNLTGSFNSDHSNKATVFQLEQTVTDKRQALFKRKQ